MAESVIQDIKDRLDVVEVIGSYLTLKRAGVNWKTNCPFHNEKTPSFNVNPGRQIWHCFGCGLGGDIFSFVQQYEHLDFPETLKLLADRAGVQLPERSLEDKERKEWREKIVRINSFAAKYYHAFLNTKAGEKALNYLLGRGLNPETINTWQIGYAPPQYRVLEQVLEKKGVTLPELIKSGLLVYAEGGRTYDRFYGRVTFPVQDFQGRVVAFSARLLEDRERAAKYVNSSESEVYRKSEVLFGLFLAKKNIATQGEVVVVEGQMDCIKAHQTGFANTVASSGTALTEQQLKLLFRLCNKIVLALDSDEAGREATYRATELALKLGFDVRIIQIAGAKDPDELISQSAEKWKTSVNSALSAVDFYIQEASQSFRVGSLELGRVVVSKILPLIRVLPSSLDKDHYLQSLSRQFALDIHSLKKDLLDSKNSSLEDRSLSGVGPDVVVGNTSRVRNLEMLILAILAKGELDLNLHAELEPDDFQSEDVKNVVVSMLAKNSLSVAEQIVLQEAEFLLESLSDELGGDVAQLALELKRTYDAFRLSGLKRKQENITFLLQAAENAKNASQLQSLKEEFAALSAKRLELERKIQNK